MKQLPLFKLPKKSNCYRCDGSGYIPEFAHVKNGRCFACNNKPRLPRPMGLANKKEK
jgi:hypothetical protein